MRFKSTRRALLKAATANGGMLAFRSFVTGIPAAALVAGLPTDEALAADPVSPQFLLMALNHVGEPINNNCPGTYDTGLSGIHHNLNASMKPENVSMGSQTHRAAKPWADLQRAVPWAMDRMSFIHHDTRTNIHSQYTGVMKLMGSSRGPNGESNSPEFMPSIYSRALAPYQGSIQQAPLYMSGSSVDFNGQALGRLRPTALQKLFPSLTNKDAIIRDIRDADLERFSQALKNGASRKQKEWLDDHVRSLDELRLLDESLIARFSDIKNAGENASIDAALIAFKLNISSVVTTSIGFGNDNHNDPNLAEEARKTVSGCKTLEYMFKRFKAEGLEDKVTFASIGVFGRTLSKTRNGDGRDHNLHHHVTLLAGKNVKGGVVGGLRKVGNDFGAMPIDAATGQASDRGNVPLDESLESTAKTIAAACGLPRDVMNTRVKRKDDNGEDKNVGRIITGALV